MSASKQNPTQKKKQDLLTELNSVLSVRAEQIRQRLLNERQTENEDDAVGLGDEENQRNEDNHQSLPVVSPGIAPVSKARLRRRQKSRMGTSVTSQRQISQAVVVKPGSEWQSKPLKGGSTIDIRNYRPGYTWNMGGRVKELRIRCIARKFLLIWQLKTFGRVPLSVAKHHYEIGLMHKTFGIWYDYWWEIVKEWRLGVRAECHHRYKLGLRMFLEWKKFVILRRVRNAKIASALRHRGNCLMHKAWEHWKIYLQHRRSQLVLKKKADNFRQACITRNAWTLWMAKHQKMLSRQENETVAMQFWAYRIQAQHWLIWKSAFEERKRELERCSDAAVYHNSIVVSKCLRAWSLYIKNRRAKKAHAEFAGRVYSANLKLQSFNHWYQRWHLLRSLQQHHLKIESLSLSFRSRWVIWRWKHYVTICKERRSQEVMADHHYNLQLMRIGLDSFRLSVVHSHIKVMRVHLAQQLRSKQLQRWAWITWITAQEQRDEAKLAPQTELAREHYNTGIMKKCFSSLVDYAQWRQHRKSQYARADAHFYLHTMPKCLFHMRMFVELERTCRENATKAQEFRRFSCLQHVFEKWHKAAVHSRDERMMYRMAVLHRESVITSSFFALWRQRTAEAVTEIERILQAHERYLVSLCYKTWCAWREFVRQKKARIVNMTKAIRHQSLRTLSASIQTWKKWVQNKKAMRIQEKKAETHHKFKVLRACIGEWKVTVAQGRRFKSLADVKYQEHSARLLRQAFQEWGITAVKLAAERRREMAASVHHNRILMQRVVQEWHRYAAIRAYKRSQTSQLLKEAINQLQRLKLSLYLKRWREEKEAAFRSHEGLEQADKHYSRCVLTKVTQTWKAYCRIRLRKRLLARQCQWFHDVRVTAKHFLVWKVRLAEYREERSKSQLAMWQWSLVLQRKVMLAWKLYAETRKHKKSRLAEAAGVWRQRLLREACGQWLATADSMSHLRSVMAARHQAKAAFDSFHLIQKCALHWKVWAKKRAAARGVQAKRDVTLTVTSSVRLASNSSRFPVTSQIYSSHPKPHSIVQKEPLKPEQASASPIRQVHHGPLQGYSSYPDTKSRPRPPPKRPAFLVDSLKRAGLYSIVHENSESQESQESALSEVDSTPSLSDLRVDPTYPEYPATGRFEPHDHISPPGHRSRQHHRSNNQDWSFSADVMSGSASTLGAGDGTVKLLHLSNSDTEHSGVRSGSSTTHSPHMFTPSTQRSQFSGNPLLYSSPVSDSNTARETWRAGLVRKDSTGVTTEAQPGDGNQAGGSGGRDIGSGKFGLDVGVTALVRGNLEGERWRGNEQAEMLVTQGTKKLEQWQQQVHRQQQRGKGSTAGQEAFVLLKPEDFMKKPSVSVGGQKQSAVTYSQSAEGDTGRKNIIKHTPRTYASHDTDQTSGLPPMAEWKSGPTESSSNQDSQKENVAPLRHTPREVCSPRRAVPQGILHNKVSDSDGDVSPLNTARSRGTVTFASPKSPTPEEEIINIRDRLKHFSQQKQKLKALRKQYRQLSDWLMEQTAQGHQEDEDSQSATEELDMLRLEVAELQAVVDSQRPICERLVLRAQILAQELQTSST